MDTVEDLRGAARRARECAVIGQAVTLARWIGNGRRPVTAGLLQVGDGSVTAGPALECWPPPFGLKEVNRRLAALGREAK